MESLNLKLQDLPEEVFIPTLYLPMSPLIKVCSYFGILFSYFMFYCNHLNLLTAVIKTMYSFNYMWNINVCFYFNNFLTYTFFWSYMQQLLGLDTDNNQRHAIIWKELNNLDDRIRFSIRYQCCTSDTLDLPQRKAKVLQVFTKPQTIHFPLISPSMN